MGDAGTAGNADGESEKGQTGEGTAVEDGWFFHVTRTEVQPAILLYP